MCKAPSNGRHGVGIFSAGNVAIESSIALSIAAAALYLASDEAAMVTGSCLSIDGGWRAGK
jgi:NAD(P)-dependent dehydrogenase (short-subunit alcohol dehydrogenase family)